LTITLSVKNLQRLLTSSLPHFAPGAIVDTLSLRYPLATCLMTTIHSILEELRSSAISERDKGDMFERLMQAFFKEDPFWLDAGGLKVPQKA